MVLSSTALRSLTATVTPLILSLVITATFSGESQFQTFYLQSFTMYYRFNSRTFHPLIRTHFHCPRPFRASLPFLCGLDSTVSYNHFLMCALNFLFCCCSFLAQAHPWFILTFHPPHAWKCGWRQTTQLCWVVWLQLHDHKPQIVLTASWQPSLISHSPRPFPLPPLSENLQQLPIPILRSRSCFLSHWENGNSLQRPSTRSHQIPCFINVLDHSHQHTYSYFPQRGKIF